MRASLKILLVLLISNSASFGQQLSQFSQYLDNYYIVNPAATNINYGANLDFSVRHQRSQVFNELSSAYISIYFGLSRPNSKQIMEQSFRINDDVVRLSSGGYYNPKITHIVGTTMSRDKFGLVDKTTSYLTYGLHIPLSRKYSISAASKIGVALLNVNDDFFVLEGGDLPFNNFINVFEKNSFMDLGMGLWLYSDEVFLGYSMERLFKGNSLSGNTDDDFEILSQHFISVGFKFNTSRHLTLTPSLFIRYRPMEPASIDYNLRASYKTFIWMNASLRKQQFLVASIGLKIKENLWFKYSYDHGANKNTFEGISANEIALSANLFRPSKK